jgi:hypothetical protein
MQFNSRTATTFLPKSFGHYEECVNFAFDAGNRRIGTIRGQYCVLMPKSLSEDLPDVALAEWNGM